MLLSLARAKHSRQAEEIATAHYRPQERRFRNFVKAPARLRIFALCWMFLSLASTGFLEQLKISNRWRIINQMFAKSLPLDARVEKYR